MDIQQIIVTLICLFCVVWIARRVYRTFRPKDKRGGTCGCCSGNCCHPSSYAKKCPKKTSEKGM